MILLLWACTSPGEKESTDSSADSGMDSGRTDTGDEPGVCGRTNSSSSDLPSSEEVLGELRDNRDAALLRWSNSHGWPVHTSEGWLVVNTDLSLDQVAGDFDSWAGTSLTTESRFSWALIPVKRGEGYKFTDQSTWAADPRARSYNYDSFGELSLVRPTAAHLDRWLEVGSDRLEARELRVWVPEGGCDHVLYVHDGQNLCDPNGIWGGWRLQESLPPKMLVVGIDNTAARMDEYTHVPDDIGDVVGGKADDYGLLLYEQVRPLIQEQYGEPGPVGIMGSSLGGLISLYLANQSPQEWDFAASLSGTVGWGSIGLHNPTVIELYAAAGHGRVPLYIDSGGSGSCFDSDGDGIRDDDPDAGDNYCENLQLAETLEQVGYQYDVDLWHWWEPEAPHNEAAWAERVFRPLEIFAGL